MTKDERRRLYSPPPGREAYDFDWLEDCSIPQSTQFMVDCLPALRRVMAECPPSDPLTVLDVGSASGAGAQLLAYLHRGSFFGRRLQVDALDNAPEFQTYAREVFTDLQDYLVGDIFELEYGRKWDIVVSSHTIEHIPNPVPFIEELRRRARQWVVLYAPFEENEPRLPDHHYSLTEDFVRSFDPESVDIVRSPAWRKPGEADSRCVLFVLRGNENPRPFRQQADAFWARGDFPAAVRMLEPIVARHPEHAEAVYCLAYSLAGAGRHSDAIYCYGRALDAGFDEYWVVYHRGLVYLGLGERAPALADLRRALELQPNSADANAALQRALAVS